MQATNVLSLRALAHKIHSCSLPLTKRESQQLLNLLSNSFQHHLDRYHPADESIGRKEGLADKTKPALLSQSTNSEPIAVPVSSRATTAEHALAILNHPLLAKKSRSNSLSQKPGTKRIATLDSQPTDALSWLEDRFANGTASLEDVLSCLKAVCGSSRSSVSTKRRELLSEFEASRKIESWVRGGGQTSEHHLYSIKPICSLWMKLLVLEERRDAIQRALMKPPTEQLRPLIACYYLAAEIQHGAGLEYAIREFLHLNIAFPQMPITQCTRPLVQWLPYYANAVSSLVYDRFTSSLKDSKYAVFDRALLTLFHPIGPTTADAFAFVTSLTTKEDITPYDTTPAKRQLMMSLTLKLAHCLIDQGKVSDAQKVLQFAQTHFPDELNTQDREAQVESRNSTAAISEEEREHVKSLDALLAI